MEDKLYQLTKENERLKQENSQYKILVKELKNQNRKLKGRLNDLGVEYYNDDLNDFEELIKHYEKEL